jgi:uncharacterized repeat protein (TIGR02543 family)
VPTRKDDTFLGWTASPGSKEVNYQPGDVFTTDADTSLYAVWQYSQPISLVVPLDTEVEAGAQIDVTVTVVNYDPANTAVLTAEAETGLIASVVSVGDIGPDGKATIRIAGIAPGTENILVRIADKGIVAVMPVRVNGGYMLGDVDGINGIMITDYITLRRWLAGWSGVVINETAADVDGMNGVSMPDAIRLRRYLAGWAGYELN